MFIRNCWYASALSNELAEGLFAVNVVGEKLVLFRREDGRVVALEDRCAHRQVPLSKGALVGGKLKCWYHGLEYDSSGQCTQVPSQRVVPPRACVRRFIAEERHGFIWVWVGDRAKADPTLIPDHQVCDSPHLPGRMTHRMVKCNYLFGIDNILDISHAAFVHGETLGSLAIAQSPPQVSITEKDVRVLRNLKREPAPPMYQSLLGLKEIDRSQEVIYWPIGNTRVETVARPPGQTEGRALRAYTTTIFTPATETETHVFVGMHRDFAVDNPQLTDVIAQKINSTVDEDRDVAEALQGNWDPDAPMIDIALDAPATAARRMLSKLLELESPEHKDSTLLRRPCRSSPANAGSREDAGLVQLNGGLS